MITKIYKAESLSEAIDTIKKEMGPRAVIVSTKKISPKRGLLRKTPGGVEVTASIDERQLTQEQIEAIDGIAANQAATSGIKDKLQGFSVSISQRAQTKSIESRIESLEEENASLRAQLKTAISHEPKQTPLGSMLGEQGFLPEIITEWETHAEGLPQNISGEETIDACAGFLLNKFSDGAKEFPKIFGLVGPAGSGKSLTAVKIALKLMSSGKKVMIVVSDDDEISGQAVKKICEKNKVECAVFEKAASFNTVIKNLAAYDHILIDTKALSPRRPQEILNLKRRLDGMNFPVYVVLSARDDDALWVVRSYVGLMICGLIFTHLDELRRVGPVFNVMAKSEVPVAYFGIGRDEREDIEEAVGERLVSLLFGMQLEMVSAKEFKVAQA